MYTLNEFISKFNNVSAGSVSDEGLTLLYNHNMGLTLNIHEKHRNLIYCIDNALRFVEYGNCFEAADAYALKLEKEDSEKEILACLEKIGFFQFNEHTFVMLEYEE